MYKLNVNANGDVEYVAPAGSSFVRSSMPEGRAVGIIESASKVEKSDKFADFEICVNDGEYYLAGNLKADEEKSKPKEDKDFITKEDYQKSKGKWKK